MKQKFNSSLAKGAKGKLLNDKHQKSNFMINASGHFDDEEHKPIQIIKMYHNSKKQATYDAGKD